MCTSLADGGKRCQSHLSGSNAVVTHAALVGQMSEKNTRNIFAFLRREGKNLPAPSRTEVEDFVNMQKVSARFDDSIPTPMKNTIIRRWGKVLQEALPTGATFHAWKNILGETMRRNRTRLAAIGVTGLIAFTAACSGQGGTVDSNKTPPPPSETSTSAPADPTKPSDGASVQGSDIGVEGFVGLRKVNVPGGSYIQSTLSPDNPLLAYNENIVQQNVKDKYSPEEIKAAQTTLVSFLAEEGLDSSLADNLTPDSRAAWFKENKDKFSSTTENLEDSVLKQDNTNGLLNSYTKEQRPGYNLSNDGKARIQDENINITQLFLNEKTGGIALQADSLVSRKTDAKNQNNTEIFSGTNIYSVVKEDGKWKIDGWQNTWTTIKVGNKDVPEGS